MQEVQEESRAAEQTELKNMKMEHEAEGKKSANSLKHHRIAETKHFETQALLHNQSRILAKAERRAFMLEDELQVRCDAAAPYKSR